MGRIIRLIDAPRIAAELALKQPIFLTTGVFDMLHDGHIKWLEKCWRISKVLYKNSILVVGVCDDETVRRFKPPVNGIERPVMLEKSRAEAVALIPYVDTVVINRQVGLSAPYERLALLLRPQFWILPEERMILPERQELIANLGIIPIYEDRVKSESKSTTEILKLMAA